MTSSSRKPKHKIITINAAMLPFKANTNYLENPSTRAPALVDFLIKQDPDVICVQELFGYFSDDALFIQKMEDAGYGVVENGRLRSGVAIFYKKDKVTPVRAFFKPHLESHRLPGLERISKKGLLVAQFQDNQSKKVFTAVSSHATGGYGGTFPYKETNMLIHGSSGRKRAQQAEHALKILKHTHAVGLVKGDEKDVGEEKKEDKLVPTAFTVMGADTNQDLNLNYRSKGKGKSEREDDSKDEGKVEGKGEGKQEDKEDLIELHSGIGISQGKLKKTGLGDFKPDHTKFREFGDFYSEFKPVRPSNYKPTIKVIPQNKGRRDDIVHKREEDKKEKEKEKGKEEVEGDKSFSGTDLYEEAIKAYNELKANKDKFKDEGSPSLYTFMEKQKKTNGKLLDILTFTGDEKLHASVRIVETVSADQKLLTDHYALAMEIEEKDEKTDYIEFQRPESHSRRQKDEMYLKLANLKWRYLQLVESRYGISHDEELTMLRIDVLNRLLDTFQESNDNAVQKHALQQALVYLRSDNPSSALADMLRTFWQENFFGVDTDEEDGDLNIRCSASALASLGNCNSMNEMRRIVKNKLHDIIDSYKETAANNTYKSDPNYPWHKHLLLLEELIRKVECPWLDIGQPSDRTFWEKNPNKYLEYIYAVIKDMVKKNSDHISIHSLEELEQALRKAVYKRHYANFPAYEIVWKTCQPQDNQIKTNVIYCYKRVADGKFEYTFKDEEGALWKREIPDDLKDSVSAAAESLQSPPGFNESLVGHINSIVADINSTSFSFVSYPKIALLGEDKQSKLNETRRKTKLLEALRNAVKSYDNMLKLDRTKIGNLLFRNGQHIDMRQMVLGNMLNYLERVEREETNLSFSEFQAKVAAEVKAALYYINADHTNGQSRIHLFLPTVSNACLALAKFQRRYLRGIQLETKAKQPSSAPDLKSDLPTVISKRRDYYVDELRGIKKAYYASLGKDISTAQFRQDWYICLALEKLIQNLMQHPLITSPEEGVYRSWKSHELDQYVFAKWASLCTAGESVIHNRIDGLKPENFEELSPVEFRVKPRVKAAAKKTA